MRRPPPLRGTQWPQLRLRGRRFRLEEPRLYGLVAGTFAGTTVGLAIGRRITERLLAEGFLGPHGRIVQLGAFGSYPNAQAFAGRLANQLPAAGVEAQIRQVNGLFRVFVGPYAARDEARRVAERLRIELGLPSSLASH